MSGILYSFQHTWPSFMVVLCNGFSISYLYNYIVLLIGLVKTTPVFRSYREVRLSNIMTVAMH
jgi:hypothetical protein